MRSTAAGSRTPPASSSGSRRARSRRPRPTSLIAKVLGRLSVEGTPMRRFRRRPSLWQSLTTTSSPIWCRTRSRMVTTLGSGNDQGLYLLGRYVSAIESCTYVYRMMQTFREELEVVWIGLCFSLLSLKSCTYLMNVVQFTRQTQTSLVSSISQGGDSSISGEFSVVR